MAKIRSRRSTPLVATPDVKNMAREDIFSKVPSMTDWTREALQGAASQYELEKLTPLSEKELKRIFPEATATVMRDPLTTQDKTRIHDNIRRDPYTGIALFTYCYFMLGPDSTITLGLNKRYANEARKADAMAAIQDNAEYLDLIEDVMQRDDAMDLQQRKLQLVFQGAAFGRSVAIKKYDKQNLPCDLIPLSSTRLGRVYVDRDWKFIGVEYNDYTRDKRILLAKDIVHYENNDMMITPRSRYYGMSMLEPIMAIGERNRVANEIAMPEIMRKMWAPILLIKVNSGSQTRINQIRDIFSMPGKTQIYNDEIEVTQVALQHDLEKLQTAVENGAKDEFRACTVPQGIGWSYDPNHATMENSLLAWYNGVLAFKRSHLDSVMWLQFYKPQLETIFENRMVARIPETGGLVDYLVQNAQTLQGNERPDLPFRITTQFNNIKTTGFLDQSSALLGWYDAGIINKEIALKEGGMEQYIDDMAEQDEKKVQLGANMLQAEMNMATTTTIAPPPPMSAANNIGAEGEVAPTTTGPAIKGVRPAGL